MKLLIFLFVSLMIGMAHAAGTTALMHATVIDGTGAAAKPGMTIVIEGKRIAGIFADGKRKLPADAKVVDLSGRYVIPGLIDAHVHLTGAEPDIAHYRTHLRTLLLGGVTAVRDMAGDDRLIAFLARQGNLDRFASPDIAYVALMAGATFFAEDKRAQAASVGKPLGFAPWMQAIAADTDIPLAMARARGTGATGIKLYANLPASTVKALTAEAHRQSLRVWTHATLFPTTPLDLVNAGVDTISHSAYLVWQAAAHVPDDYRMRAHGDFRRIRPDAPQLLALFEAMKKHHTILDATLRVFLREAEEHPDAVGAGIMPWSYKVTRLAHERGVLIDAGTDSAGLTGDKDTERTPAIYQEMALLVKHSGFTPLQAIRAATQVSAMALGQSASRGTITRGKLADLVVLKSNPADDIHNIGDVDFVIKHGTRYQRQAATPERRENRP